MDNFALNQLAQIVYDYCGLNYLNNLSSLNLKISKRLQQLNNLSIWAYIRLLDENNHEWEVLVELLTINETYFYREDKQLTEFQQVVLPEIVNHKDGQIKVWSAACSTGEEPYSLAIMTAESDINNEKVKIVGTDINKKVLNIASRGFYNKRSLSFRRIPSFWLQKYFHEREEGYEVCTPIRNMVEFDYLNLLNLVASKQNEQYDVIFCRNVLIYFDEETIQKVVTAFYHSLKKGGYLFLGHAESIAKFNIGFETVNANGTFYYRKG